MSTTTKPSPIRQHIDYLVAMGFDLTDHARGQPGFIRISCSQCCACTINGTPCHERGCRNEMKECNGCGNIVPRNVKYCSDCQ